MVKLSSMHFMISHIYREGNHCADKLSNLGLSNTNNVDTNDQFDDQLKKLL